jgi:branched-chain amino acid transport system permease protein
MTSVAITTSKRPGGVNAVLALLGVSTLLLLAVAVQALGAQSGATLLQPRAVLLVTGVLAVVLVLFHGWTIWRVLRGRPGSYAAVHNAFSAALAVLVLLPNPFLFDGREFASGLVALSGVALFLIELALGCSALALLRQDEVRQAMGAKRPAAWSNFLGSVGLLYLLRLLGPVAQLDVPVIIGKMAADPALLVQYFIIGLANGAILAIIALGYTMVYGIIELINFAHGDVFMIGAFTALTVFGLFTIDKNTPLGVQLTAIGIAMVLSVAVCAALNATIERLAYRPLRNAPRLAPLISAIGVSFILQNIGLFWGSLRAFIPIMGVNAAAPKSFPPLLGEDNLVAGLGIAGLRVTSKDLMVFAIALTLMVVLRLFVQYTTLGKAMRATAQNRDAAKIMGIDIDRVIMITFLIGGGLAGAAGVLFGVYIGSAVFTMGFTAGLRAFTAAVLGGIGNTTGAMLGGFLIGLLISLSDAYLKADWTNAWVFMTLVIILIFRPNGLLGEYVAEKA